MDYHSEVIMNNLFFSKGKSQFTANKFDASMIRRKISDELAIEKSIYRRKVKRSFYLEDLKKGISDRKDYTGGDLKAYQHYFSKQR